MSAPAQPEVAPPEMTMPDRATPSTAAPEGSTGHRSIITILLVAAFVVILNETTMNVALSSIMGDFGVTERAAQWLTTAFMLTMAVVIPITGWLLERLPTRSVFTLAMTLFSAGTLIAALAPTFALLLAGRVVQASGTAVMMPLLMTTIMHLVPPHARGQMMGNISMVIAVAPATGPTLSGLLLQWGSWRFIFWFVLPIALAILALGWMRLRNANEPRSIPLDGWSIQLTVLAFGPLVYGLSQIGDPTVPLGELLLPLGIGVAGLVGFTIRQVALQAHDRAFLDLRPFRVGTFTIALMMMALGMMALFGTVIMLPLLLQRAYGLEPIHVGLMMLPGGVAMGVMGPVIGRLFDRVGPRPLVVPASLVVLGVFVSFALLTPDTPWWLVMVGHMTMSTSFAFIFTPLFTVALGSLPKRLYSHGSALIGTIQQVAGAAGTALFVTVFAMQSQAAATGGASEVTAMLEGTRWAFLGAGAVWCVSIIAGLFLRRPTETEADAPLLAH